MLYVESINNALYNLMDLDSDVVLVGEDLHDPYGGAFKVSKGLSTSFPNQVISTPISEQAIVGACVGMAMRGMKPIVEIMFGDFITLCVDQIVNHATKYHWMYNEQVNVPLVIRAPMGGGRGYGPTHSQSLESMFMPVSGLKICAPSIFHDPGSLLSECVINENHPVLFIENKLSYPKKIQIEEKLNGGNIHRKVLEKKNNSSETILLSLYPDENPEIVIITYGGMAETALNAALDLFFEDEILVNIIILSVIRPIPIKEFLSEIKRAESCLILEEGNKLGGWGGELASQIYETCFNSLVMPIQRLGSDDSPIPSSIYLEKNVIPSKEKIVKTVKSMRS